MGNDQNRSDEPRGGSGGIEPMWDKSYVDPACFDWHREGQLDPLLGKLQSEQGASAVWAFGLACLEPLRSTHHLLPKLLQEASHGFTDPERRRRARRSFGSAAGGAGAIGLRHGMPCAAAFLAGFQLLAQRPLEGVAAACAYARLAAACLERHRVLDAFPSRNSLPTHSPPATATRRLQAQSLSRLISIDAETAELLLDRSSRVGGERTRLVVGHIAQVEAEAIAWLDQLTRLEVMLENGGLPA